MEERIIKDINNLLTQLFAKMHEIGYEWDAEKKELKKIEYEIEIPFGAKDSELQEATYYIPKGFHAEIDDDKVVIKKGEKPIAWSEEDKQTMNKLLSLLLTNHPDVWAMFGHWLKSLKDRVQVLHQNNWKPSESDIHLLERIANGKSNPQDFQASLYGLIGQLKKLKEE